MDSTIKKNEKGKLIQGFSPRKKTSNWTELNKERVRWLSAFELMKEGIKPSKRRRADVCRSTNIHNKF